MPDVDKRVVEMEFNNERFNKNMKSTINVLHDLDDSLVLKNQSKSLDAIAQSTESMSSGIDKVQAKMNAAGAAAFTTVSRLTNKVMDLGSTMLKSLTVQPLMDGFKEYETKMGSIQTILANTKGDSNLKQVNSALDELNTYADKTIYNFTEMTKNIGTFTAAGVKLKPATKAIQGIANLAAVSGSTSQQASTAMYQLSQALAAGKVNLQDWNSVVNAGMGGKVFQEALKRTSRVYGTGVDEAIKKNGTFRESLSKGKWLTKEVLTDTLNQFAGAYSDADLLAKGFSKTQVKEIQSMAKTAENAATKVKTWSQLVDTVNEAVGSGWTNTWETIVGDFNQAETLWTGVSDHINNFVNAFSNARNSVLKFWAANQGRDELIRTLEEVFTSFGNVVKSVSQGLSKAIPPVTGKTLLAITYNVERLFENFKHFTASLRGDFSVAFKGFGTMLKSFGIAISGIAKGIGNALYPAIKGVTRVVSNAARVLGQFLNGVFGNTDGVKNLAKMFENAGTAVGNFISKLTGGLSKTSQAYHDEYRVSKWMKDDQAELKKSIKSEQQALKDREKGYTSSVKSIQSSLAKNKAALTKLSNMTDSQYADKNYEKQYDAYKASLKKQYKAAAAEANKYQKDAMAKYGYSTNETKVGRKVSVDYTINDAQAQAKYETLNKKATEARIRLAQSDQAGYYKAIGDQASKWRSQAIDKLKKSIAEEEKALKSRTANYSKSGKQLQAQLQGNQQRLARMQKAPKKESVNGWISDLASDEVAKATKKAKSRYDELMSAARKYTGNQKLTYDQLMKLDTSKLSKKEAASIDTLWKAYGKASDNRKAIVASANSDHFIQDQYQKDRKRLKELTELRKTYTDEYLKQGKKVPASIQKQLDSYDALYKKTHREGVYVRYLSGQTKQYQSFGDVVTEAGKTVNKVWTGITKVITSAANIISSGFGGIKAAIQPITKTLGSGFSSALASAKTSLNGFGISAQDAFAVAAPEVEKGTKSIISNVKHIGGGIGTAFVTAFSGVPDSASQAFNTVVTSIGNALNTIKQVISPVAVDVKSFFDSNILPVIQDFFKAIAPVFESFFDYIDKNAGPIIEGAGKKIADWFEDLSKMDLSPVGDILSGIADAFKGLFKSMTSGGFDISSIGDFFSSLLQPFSNVQESASDAAGSIQNVQDTVSSGDGNPDWLANLADSFTKVGDGATSLNDLLNNVKTTLSGGTKAVVNGEQQTADSTNDTAQALNDAGDSAENFLQNVAAIPNALRNPTATVQKFMDSFDPTSLVNFGTGLFAGGMMMSIYKGVNALMEVPKSLAGVAKSISGFFDAMKPSKIQKNATGILMIAGALGILAVSLALVANIKADDLAKAGVAMGVALVALIAGLHAANEAMDGVDEKQVTRLGVTMLVLSGSMMILASAADTMGAIPEDNLKRAAIAMGAYMGTVAGLIALTKLPGAKTATTTIKGIGLMALGISASMLILANAFNMFGSMDTDVFNTAAIRISGITAVILGAAAVMSKFGNLKKELTELDIFITALSIAMNLLSDSFEKMGNLNEDQLKNGLLVLIGVMGSLVGMAEIMQSVKNIDKNIALLGVGMLGISASMVVLSTSLAMLSALDPDKLAASVQNLCVMLLVMTAAIAGLMIVMSSTGTSGMEMIQLAGAFTLFSVSVGVLAAALTLLSLVPSDKLLQVSVALGAFVLAFAGLSILASNPAIAVGMETVSLALLGISAAMLIAAVAFNSFVKTLTLLGAVFPMVATGLSTGMKTLVDGLSDVSNSVPNAIPAMVMLAALAIILPPLTFSLNMFVDALNKWAAIDADTIKTGVENIVEGLTTFGDHAAEIAGAGVKIVSEFILGLLNALTENMPKITKAAADLIIAFIKGITKNLVRIVDAAFKCIIEFINGLAKAIEKNHGALNKAIVRLINAILDALKDLGHRMGIKGDNGVVGFINGLGQHISDVFKKAGEIKDNVMGAVSGAGDWLYDTGKNIIDGLTNGIDSFIGNVRTSAEDIANKVKDGVADFLGIHSPSKVMYQFGRWTVEGFANGIKNNQKLTRFAIKNWQTAFNKQINQDPMTVDSRVGLVLGGLDTDPVIRPVMDLNALESGVAQANRLMASNALYQASMAGNLMANGGFKMGSSVVNNNKISLTVSVPVSQVGETVDTDRLANDVASSIADALNNRLVTQGR